MREIEFRGKSKNSGRWVYGDLITQRYNSRQGIHIYEKNDKLQSGYQFVRVDKKTIGQYTGRKDKNGKEIYEEDIVLVSNQAKAIIMYDDKRAAFVLNYGQDEVPIHSEIYSDLEVIGNVFDNPEWLEGEIKL